MTVTINATELRRLAEQATPGPWHAPDPPDGVGEGMLYADDGWAIVDSFLFANEERRQATKGWNVPFTRPDGQHQRDAAYIAAASPDVILSLLDELERPRWHHDKTLSPEDRQYCDDCDERERRVAALEKALRRVVGDCDPLGTDPGYNEARALLQDKDKVTP
jgi:hypothetical protein